VTREHDALLSHPGLEIADQRGDVGSAQLQASIGGEAVERALGIEDQVNAAHRLARQRR
jgi:hypothetical protein